MPFVLRYSNNDTGAITFTGNTLGLSRSNETEVPGTRDFIGAFVTVDTSMQFGSYPPGTTADFNLNSASAILSPIVTEPGGELTFSFIITNMTGTVLITNISPIVLNNVILFDDLPAGTRFQEDSVIINNQVAANVDPERGIRLGTLTPGETVRVTFQALQLTVPPNERAENQGRVTFEPEGSDETFEVDSNIVIFEVMEEEE